MILVVAEQRGGVVNRATWEVVAAAQEMAAQGHGQVKLIAIGAVVPVAKGSKTIAGHLSDCSNWSTRLFHKPLVDLDKVLNDEFARRFFQFHFQLDIQVAEDFYFPGPEHCIQVRRDADQEQYRCCAHQT